MSDERDERMIELAELYALGGLEPAERAAVEAYLRSEGCRSTLARGRLLSYALAASVSEKPPDALRERILAAIKNQASPSAKPRTPSAPTQLRPAFWMQPAWLAAAAALVVLVFGMMWIGQRFSTMSYKASCTPAPCSVTASVVSPPGRNLRLEAHGLKQLPPGKVYQAWYIRPGASPTPAPTFIPNPNGDATVELPVGAEKGLTVAVTVEPQGGSKAPTTKPFLVASIQ
jgi:anti-sigma-K factor RskA